MTSTLAAIPRVRLLTCPTTPLQPAPRLSHALGLEIWLKRDDLTGFGLGGNKARALEYLIADARQQACDCLVTGAGPQSNWAMLAALAARVHGIDPYVVHYGRPPPLVGNVLLHRLVGTHVKFTGDADRASVDGAIDELAAVLRAEGRRPYVLPRGGATPLGSLGYVAATTELADQLRELDVHPNEVWLATGSCGTQAGLVAGAREAGLDATIVGVTVSRPTSECRERVATLATGAMALVGTRAPMAETRVVDGFAGPGYGQASPAGQAAARLVARTEGIFLDPVFGAKAMAALVDHARGGAARGPVVFLVSGGAPTLFAGQTVHLTDPVAEAG